MQVLCHNGPRVPPPAGMIYAGQELCHYVIRDTVFCITHLYRVGTQLALANRRPHRRIKNHATSRTMPELASLVIPTVSGLGTKHACTIVIGRRVTTAPDHFLFIVYRPWGTTHKEGMRDSRSWTHHRIPT